MSIAQEERKPTHQLLNSGICLVLQVWLFSYLAIVYWTLRTEQVSYTRHTEPNARYHGTQSAAARADSLLCSPNADFFFFEQLTTMRQR